MVQSVISVVLDQECHDRPIVTLDLLRLCHFTISCIKTRKMINII